jgi:ribosomal protein L11 methyltransferase
VSVRSRNSSKRLWKIAVRIAPEAEDAVIELFRAVFGQPASVYSDVAKRSTIASAFVDSVSERQRLELRRGLDAIREAGIELGPGRISVQSIARENWAESWKRHFKPLEISSRLLVIPSWSKQKPRPGQAVVVLDPGLSFGTGHHPTTAFCLEQIACLRNGRARQSLLDIGSGSGILSIGAAKLGYSPVVAFDFDRDAVRVAKENAKANGVRLQLSQQDLTELPERSPKRFDVVCANLIYDLLIQERLKIINRLAPRGTLVLAGILKEQFPKVERAFEGMAFRLVASRSGKEWRSGTFRAE